MMPESIHVYKANELAQRESSSTLKFDMEGKKVRSRNKKCGAQSAD